jgi:hypothetical protein
MGSCLGCLLALALVFNAQAQEQTIDFEDLVEGQVVTTVFANDGGAPGFGPILVFGVNIGDDPAGTTNAAIIFDSDCHGDRTCTGGDTDLGSPNKDFGGPGQGAGGEAGSAFQNDTALGNILIVHEHLDEIIGGFVADPDDETGASMITIDFPEPVTVCEFTIIDREANESQNVELFGLGGVSLGNFTTTATGNNGVDVIQTDSNGPDSCTLGVVQMVMSHQGSGGLDNIVLIPQPPPGGCSYTPGYWMNHPEDWPVNSLELGGVVYTQEELLAIMAGGNGGDKWLVMAFHTIAAKLNVANGADPTALGTAIADADAWLAAHSSPQRGWDGGEEIKNTMDAFANGDIGPGHCDDVNGEEGAGKRLVQQTGDTPSTHALNGNYPNPFNPETTINFSVEESAQVRLAVYDMLGRELQVLVDGVLDAGTYNARFDAADLPSGTYLYRLVTPTGTFTKMMMLLK